MVNKEKIIEGIKLIIEGIGEDLEREGLKETPERIARMYEEELFSGLYEDVSIHMQKRFHVEDNQIVMEKDIPFYSMCEHHFLPFFGNVHIAYVPNGEVLGLSKLARCVEVFARRPQIQERMTAQIADAIMEHLNPKGVMVMVEAKEHMCMSMRGVKKPGTKTVTLVTRGCFEDTKMQETFYRLL
ncbi:MAG: GTP cyclohydrolase I FolE [Lachnospiraceae bacterium]|nr:GTP cyclohydrolase I FolE [Lachnospiraceae bacterium]